MNLVTCSNFRGSVPEYGVQEFPLVDETLVWGTANTDTKVAILSLEGVIIRESTSTLFGEVIDPVTRLLQEIRAVTVDTDVDGILLVVDSPGGGVTASDEIYHALMAFKQSRPDRKIVVHVRDMAASGGYYVALAGDLIVGQPTSVVGSIGVIISAVNMHQLGEKIGLQDVSVTSSSNKALLNPLDPINDTHSEILQGVVDQMYERFKTLVLENRPFNEEFAHENSIFDGRIFGQAEAMGLGLVDETGYLDQSRRRMLDLLGVSEAGFYEMNYQVGGWGSLFSVETPEILTPLKANSGFQYLWKP